MIIKFCFHSKEGCECMCESERRERKNEKFSVDKQDFVTKLRSIVLL